MANRYSREELASVLGVSRQTITKWENGSSVPNIEDAKKLAKVFHLSLDELVGNDVCGKLGPDEKGFWGTVSVKNGGYVMIPKKVLDFMDIRWGDELLIVTDIERGIELLPKDILWESLLKKYSSCEKIN